MQSGGRRYIRGLLSLSSGYVVFSFVIFLQLLFYVVARGRVVALGAIVALGAAEPRETRGDSREH